jgi:hypothetical protein
MPDDVDSGYDERDERNVSDVEGAGDASVLTIDTFSRGYVTEEGVYAGIFWWNDPVYPANGDAAEFVRAQDERALEAGMLGYPGPDEPRQLEPA